jgi:hypothetical protein
MVYVYYIYTILAGRHQAGAGDRTRPHRRTGQSFAFNQYVDKSIILVMYIYRVVYIHTILAGRHQAGACDRTRPHRRTGRSFASM